MRIVNKIVVLISMFLMFLLIGNKALFWHSHILPDGKIIHHAHPFSKSKENTTDTQHKHSNFEFLVLLQLQILITVAALFFTFKNSVLIRIIYTPINSWFFSSPEYFQSLRAPPFSK